MAYPAGRRHEFTFLAKAKALPHEGASALVKSTHEHVFTPPAVEPVCTFCCCFCCQCHFVEASTTTPLAILQLGKQAMQCFLTTYDSVPAYSVSTSSPKMLTACCWSYMTKGIQAWWLLVLRTEKQFGDILI